MTTSIASLDELRRRIDEIDDRLHDLIMQRAEIVEAIAGSKQRSKAPVIRPGREALIIRRLVARHQGRFPRQMLLHIWRELISGAVIMQGDFAVAVLVRDGVSSYWDIARDHYGSYALLTPYRSVGEVLRATAEGRSAVGVLPMPADGEKDPWWQVLALSGPAAPRVMARLPFGEGGRGRSESPGALVIGFAEPDPTGGDRTLIVLEAHREVSRARIINAFNGAGLPVTFFTSHEADVEIAWNLVEVDALVALDDARVRAALSPMGDRVERVLPLGSYARPFAAAALEDDGAG